MLLIYSNNLIFPILIDVIIVYNMVYVYSIRRHINQLKLCYIDAIIKNIANTNNGGKASSPPLSSTSTSSAVAVAVETVSSKTVTMNH